MWNGGIGRAFSPFGRVDVLSRGVAPVWYGVGPLALAGGVVYSLKGQRPAAIPAWGNAPVTTRK